MQRTLPRPWLELRKHFETDDELAEAIGVSQKSFFRIARGTQRPSNPVQETVRILSELYGVPNPLDKIRPVNTNLQDLRDFGLAMVEGFPPSSSEVKRLRGLYPENQLIDLAESDGTPPHIMAACRVLLEPAPLLDNDED